MFSMVKRLNRRLDDVEAQEDIMAFPPGVGYPSIDPFGSLRVSERFTLFDAQMQYGKYALFWEDALTGSGSSTHLPNESAVRMRCTTANGDKVVRQTKRYFRYQPGKGQQVFMTFNPGGTKANCRRRVGLFDVQNGVYFELDGTTAYMVERTFTGGSASNTRTAQTSWNLDKMDGTGASGVTLDFSKVQILVIDFEWLGVGTIRYGWVVNGLIRYCHAAHHANSGTTVYMTTANLPLRYEIENTAATASTTDLLQICSTVGSEGGVQERALVLSASNGVTTRSVTATPLPVLSIRVATVLPSGGSITNRSTVVPVEISLYADQPIFYQIVYNTTLTGASFAAVNTTYSGVEYDVSATAISGGVVIDAGYLAASASTRGSFSDELAAILFLTTDVAGTTGDILSIVCTRVTASSATTGAAIKWKELY